MSDSLPLQSLTNSELDLTTRKRRMLQAAIERQLLNDDRLLAGFVDTDGVLETLTTLNDAFPEHFRHTFAAKANSLRAALSLIKDSGLGCEVASPGELHAALQAGFATQQIVYDEPAKTEPLLRRLVDNGIAFNIDSFQELKRVAKIVSGDGSNSTIGFRVNPQVGSGSIGAMSTATRTSKFGIALQDNQNRETIVEACRDYSWLNSLHTHIGSQGCPLQLMVRGIRDVVDLALDINRRTGRAQIATLDIGGGLPVNFADDSVTPTFGDYAAMLRDEVPELFSGEFIVKTEFGRSIFAKNGFIAARVEYTKTAGGRPIAITHAGAQTATRTVFMPDLWAIRIGVFDALGREKRGDLLEQDVAGPCCFAGDVIAHKRLLPRIEPGDYIVLHDTGAYYFSNHFFYNSMPAIAVYGAGIDSANVVDFDTWRRQPSLDDMLGLLS